MFLNDMMPAMTQVYLGFFIATATAVFMVKCSVCLVMLDIAGVLKTILGYAPVVVGFLFVNELTGEYHGGPLTKVISATLEVLYDTALTILPIVFVILTVGASGSMVFRRWPGWFEFRVRCFMLIYRFVIWKTGGRVQMDR